MFSAIMLLAFGAVVALLAFSIAATGLSLVHRAIVTAVELIMLTRDTSSTVVFLTASATLLLAGWLLFSLPAGQVFVLTHYSKIQFGSGSMGVAVLVYLGVYFITAMRWHEPRPGDCHELGLFNHAICTAAWFANKREQRPDDVSYLAMIVGLTSFWLWAKSFSFVRSDFHWKQLMGSNNLVDQSCTLVSMISESKSSILESNGQILVSNRQISNWTSHIYQQFRKTVDVLERLIKSTEASKNAFYDASASITSTVEAFIKGYTTTMIEELAMQITPLLASLLKVCEKIDRVFNSLWPCLDKHFGKLEKMTIDQMNLVKQQLKDDFAIHVSDLLKDQLASQENHKAVTGRLDALATDMQKFQEKHLQALQKLQHHQKLTEERLVQDRPKADNVQQSELATKDQMADALRGLKCLLQAQDDFLTEQLKQKQMKTQESKATEDQPNIDVKAQLDSLSKTLADFVSNQEKLKLRLKEREKESKADQKTTLGRLQLIFEEIHRHGSKNQDTLEKLKSSYQQIEVGMADNRDQLQGLASQYSQVVQLLEMSAFQPFPFIDEGSVPELPAADLGSGPSAPQPAAGPPVDFVSPTDLTIDPAETAPTGDALDSTSVPKYIASDDEWLAQFVEEIDQAEVAQNLDFIEKLNASESAPTPFVIPGLDDLGDAPSSTPAATTPVKSLTAAPASSASDSNHSFDSLFDESEPEAGPEPKPESKPEPSKSPPPAQLAPAPSSIPPVADMPSEPAATFPTPSMVNLPTKTAAMTKPQVTFPTPSVAGSSLRKPVVTKPTAPVVLPGLQEFPDASAEADTDPQVQMTGKRVKKASSPQTPSPPEATKPSSPSRLPAASTFRTPFRLKSTFKPPVPSPLSVSSSAPTDATIFQAPSQLKVSAPSLSSEPTATEGATAAGNIQAPSSSFTFKVERPETPGGASASLGPANSNIFFKIALPDPNVDPRLLNPESSQPTTFSTPEPAATVPETIMTEPFGDDEVKYFPEITPQTNVSPESPPLTDEYLIDYFTEAMGESTYFPQETVDESMTIDLG